MRKILSIMVLLVLFSTPAIGETLLFQTDQYDELVQNLPLKHNPYEFYTLYSLHLPDLLEGDIVDVSTQFEATNDLGFNVMFSHFVQIQSAETVWIGLKSFPSDPFVVPCYPAGENITPGMHHGHRSISGDYVIPSDGDYWISVIVYAASSAAGYGDTLQIEQGYGGVSAKVTR